MQTKQVLHSAAALTLMLSVLAVQPVRAAQTVIKIDGSSTVYPITEAVAEEFQKEGKGKIQVTVGISGTGGGFKKFCRGDTDISNASRPILASEMAACRNAGFDGTAVVTGPRIGAKGVEYYELPVAFDALTVVVNPKNDWVKSLTVAELKKMWEPAAQGKITSWKQVRDSFPDAPLKLFGAGSDSGTFDYFTEATVGKAKASRGDYTASEDDNVLVQGVSQDKNALGYFGYAYYVENQAKLKAVGIDGGKGPVVPAEATVIDGTYQPMSRPIFIYINKRSAERPEVKQFIEFYLKNAASLVKQVKYVPLPALAYTTALEHFAKGKTGTVFNGQAEVGVRIEDLQKREGKL
ncbi:MAG: PstS family phosphate ABC transporter substrate-binding protein [Gammaproteobacteria bacterium]|nr:PstS family phosphate ABC transporter substrate-binding protein [Gammaproteobacteria bacterium]